MTANNVLESNGPDGVFGTIADHDDSWAYSGVVHIGEDIYLDVEGQVASAGSVVHAIGFGLEVADILAPTLVDFLRGLSPAGTPPFGSA